MERTASPLSSRLREARHALGQPAAVVAVAAGINPGTLSRIETGVVLPSLGTLYQLACVLDLDDLTSALGPYLSEPPA